MLTQKAGFAGLRDNLGRPAVQSLSGVSLLSGVAGSVSSSFEALDPLSEIFVERV